MTLKLGMRHQVLEYYQVCSNDDPALTLRYFMPRSNLVPYVFVWEKGKAMDVSETFKNLASIGLMVSEKMFEKLLSMIWN